MELKTSNHMKAPQCASFVASLRNVFGNENVQVLYVKEGEVELGEKQPEGVVPVLIPKEEEKKPAKKTRSQMEIAA